MKKDQYHVSEVSDIDLFRAYANMLWTRYDLGGISVGRSYQASLLESFLYLHDVEITLSYIGGDVEKEIKKRLRWKIQSSKPSPAQKQKLEDQWLPFQDLSILNLAEFTLFTLIEMKRWYQEEAEGLGYLSQTHRSMAYTLWEFFSYVYPEITPTRFNEVAKNAKNIADEGRERLNYKLNTQSRHDDFEKFGVSPFG